MQQEIEDFFERYVFGWMFSDMRICEEGGANFGGTALVCSYIDFVGKLYLGIKRDGDVEKRFSMFIDDFFDNKYKPFLKFIYSDYRCGLLHQFFPKKGGGITRGEENRKYHLTIDRENEIIPINLTVFFEDFRNAVKNYYEKLKEDKQLQANFLMVYQSMRDEKSEHFKELLGRDIVDEPKIFSTSTSSIVGGASLMHDLDSHTSRMPFPPSVDEKDREK